MQPPSQRSVSRGMGLDEFRRIHIFINEKKILAPDFLLLFISWNDLNSRYELNKARYSEPAASRAAWARAFVEALLDALDRSPFTTTLVRTPNFVIGIDR